MIILGINGWYTRSHDASACLVKDGEILAMAEEERFIRKKYAFDKIPINAIGYCLNETNISPNKIDIVAFGWDYRLMYSLRRIKFSHHNNEILDTIFPRSTFGYNENRNWLSFPII